MLRFIGHSFIPTSFSSSSSSSSCSSYSSFSVSTSRLMSGSEGRMGTRTNERRERVRNDERRWMQFSSSFSLLLSLPLSLSLSRPVFSRQAITGFRDPLLNLQSVQETRALTYRSRARLRNTRDRSIEKRSIESWIHVVFAGRSSPLLLLSRARFACDAVVDVVESTISPLPSS